MKTQRRRPLGAKSCRWWALFLLLSVAGPALADESLQAISLAATTAVQQYYDLPGNRVVIKADPLSARLQLADCHQPLIATVPKLSSPRSRLSVPVQCPGAGGWSIRVPLRLQLFRTVLVASRPLMRGDGLRPGDVHGEERDITRLGYGYIENLQQLDGRTLAHSLPRDGVITPTVLGGRHMVRAGDHVQVVARMNGIQVTTAGIALGGGDNGARLRVRNENSGRIIDAMVQAPGQVLALP